MAYSEVEKKSENSSGNGPGRRRSDQSHKAILQATLDILKKDGYNAVTIEAIAAKAGVGKQTIYRWWPSKAAVVQEALVTQTQNWVPQPDHNDLRLDLLEFIKTAFRVSNDLTGPIVSGLMADSLLDPEFAESFRSVFIKQRRAALREIFEQGIERGEIPAETDLELMLDLIYGVLWYRLLIQHAPLDEKLAGQLVALILDQKLPLENQE